MTPQLVRFPLPSASQRPTWDTLSHAPAPRLAHRRGECSYQGSTVKPQPLQTSLRTLGGPAQWIRRRRCVGFIAQVGRKS